MEWCKSVQLIESNDCIYVDSIMVINWSSDVYIFPLLVEMYTTIIWHDYVSLCHTLAFKFQKGFYSLGHKTQLLESMKAHTIFRESNIWTSTKAQR